MQPIDTAGFSLLSRDIPNAYTLRVETIGERIRRLRKEREAARAGGDDWTQVGLAARVGVRQGDISKYENGRSVPETETLIRLAGIFGLTIDQLVHGAELREKKKKSRRDPLCHATDVTIEAYTSSSQPLQSRGRHQGDQGEAPSSSSRRAPVQPLPRLDADRVGAELQALVGNLNRLRDQSIEDFSRTFSALTGRISELANSILTGQVVSVDAVAPNQHAEVPHAGRRAHHGPRRKSS